MNFFTRFISNLRIPALTVKFDEGDVNNPTIVLLPGIAATSKTWDPLIKLLDTSQYRVISFDMLGFGSSPAPRNIEYSVDQHMKAVQKTLKKNKVRTPFILIGHSMGAVVAARYCKKYPSNVTHAILASLPLYPEVTSAHNLLTRKLNNAHMRAYKYLRENPRFTKAGAKRLRQILRVNDGIDITDTTWEPFALSLKNTIEKQTTIHDIAATSVPVTEIHGSLDQVIITANMKQLNTIKGVEIITLKRERHTISDTFAQKIYERLLSILAG